MVRNYFYYDNIDSTMLEIALLQELDQSASVVVRADMQTQGQGRGSNRWDSANGGLWFSFSFGELELVESFALYIGACLHKSLISLYPQLLPDLKIKWPNDIYLGGKKLAGILCKYSSSHNSYTIGIGLNTNNTSTNKQIEHISSGLAQYMGFRVSNELLMRLIIDEVDSRLELAQNKYISYCDTQLYAKGRAARIDDGSNEEGIVNGLNDAGALLLVNSDGTCKAYNFGSLQIL